MYSAMKFPNVKTIWLFLLPALAAGQTPDKLPVQHDGVDLHGTAPDTPAVFSAATPVEAGGRIVHVGNYQRRFRADFDVIF